MSILSYKPTSCQRTIYLIAENRRAAEELGRRLALRDSYRECTTATREAAIQRWRNMPTSIRQRYHVYGVGVLVTDDATITNKLVRLALKTVAACVVGAIAGGVIH